MAYTLSIELRPDLNLAIWRVTGAVPIKVMTGAIESYVRDGFYQPGMNLLSLNSQITSSYSQEELDSLMGVVTGVYGPHDRNLLCASVFGERLQYGLGRMFEVTAQDSILSFKPFYKLSEAKSWLKIPDDVAIDEGVPTPGFECLKFHGD